VRVEVKSAAVQFNQLKPTDQKLFVQIEGYGSVQYRLLSKIFTVLRQTGIKSVRLDKCANSDIQISWGHPGPGGYYQLKTHEKAEIGARWHPIEAEGGLAMPTNNNVVSITKKIAENQRLVCKECSHKVQSEDDWDLGLDFPVSRQAPQGFADSGCYVCPQCQTIQDHTYLDGMVKFTTKGPAAGLSCHIPMDTLLELLDVDLPDSKARMNIGQAIVNAVKRELIEHFEDEAVQMFPQDAALISERIAEGGKTHE